MHNDPPISLSNLDFAQFETPAVFKALTKASRALAELKGVAETIPNQAILINSLTLQEAGVSSEIENIVTTQDEIFRADASPHSISNQDPAAKEVLHYREALATGFTDVRNTELLTNSQLLSIQACLEKNKAGFRRVPGTALKDGRGNVVYTPPQSATEIEDLMSELEKFIHLPADEEPDPLIRMALIHHQFESIHPFYDGNGRTGRILNVLYLVKEGLLKIPVLYLSKAILETKADYYRLLQEVREKQNWEDWVIYMLEAITDSSEHTIKIIQAIHTGLLSFKHRIRDEFSFYSQDLVNILFTHPYTKISFLTEELNISRITAAKYLDALTEAGILEKRKVGRSNYYLNLTLIQALATGK